MRSKLTAVVLVPTLATVALAGTRVAAAGSDARTFDRVATLADLGRQVTGLVHELQTERDLTSRFSASGRQKGANEVEAARQKVDQSLSSYTAAANAIDSSYSPDLHSQFVLVADNLAGLTQLRQAVGNAGLTRTSILAEYSTNIRALLDLDASIAATANDRDLDRAVRALSDVSQVKEFASQVRAELLAILDQKSFAVGQFQDFVAVVSREQSASDQFRVDASTADQALFADTISGPDVSNARTIQDTAVREQLSSLLGNEPKQGADDWYAAESKKIDLMRQVEQKLLANVISLSDDLRSSKQQDGIVAAVELLAVLLAAAIATIIVARSMTRPLRILRSTALDVADRRLPEVIERLRQADTGNLADIKVEPTGIDSHDEIGEVAQAFDAVHREAVRLAVDQASLRQSVNSMFVNLSRRSQGLVERQLRLIDELESSEQNPDQLENLFKLDHLATRMRRTDDSLLVLAGSETGRGWNAPMSVPDVLLASISEVEQYTRITRTTVTEAGLVGYIVSDVVHLLAELMENATAFSPPETTVTVSCRKLSGRGGAMIEIEDHGIGMTSEELETANARLAAPHTIDVAVVRTMGLFVVGRLANKHNIRVQLRNSPRSGLTALVLLPPALITNLNGDGSGEAGDDGVPFGSPTGQETHDMRGEYGHNGVAGGSPGNDAGPLQMEPSPIFDSVSEWFRHRRRIDHDAVQDRSSNLYASRPPTYSRTPAPDRESPAPPRQGPPRQGPPRQAPPRPVPPRQDPPRQDPPRSTPPRQAPTGQARAGQESPPPLGPTRQPRQGPRPPEAEESPTAIHRPAPQRQGPTPPPAPGTPSLPRRGGPVRRTGGTPPASSTSPSLQRPPVPRAPDPQPVTRDTEEWSTPADEGWRAAEAASAPSYDRMTPSGLPVRKPRAHLFPGSASTDKQNRTSVSRKPETDNRSPDTIRSVLSTYYSSYRRGRTDEGDPGGRHRAGFGMIPSDEQEGS
ncbi:MAG TPA: nitrate- and nitrite sensing domain-containing protein [Mycobacteriales bacterium]